MLVVDARVGHILLLVACSHQTIHHECLQKHVSLGTRRAAGSQTTTRYVVADRRQWCESVSYDSVPFAALLFPRASTSNLPSILSFQCCRSQGTHKQSQSNYVAVATMEGEDGRMITPSATMQTSSQSFSPSAKDIHRLLCNIGAGHSASLPMINSMMKARNGHRDEPVSAHELIDLIAQIRSL